ncbi:MAG: transposase [Bacteroidia bacterium]
MLTALQMCMNCLHGCPDHRTELLIRSNHNRNIVEGVVNPRSYLASLDSLGTYEVVIRQDLRRKTPKRRAQVELRATTITLKRPKRAKSSCIDQYPPTVRLQVVQAKETPASAKGVKKPIHWILLTTHPVDTFEEARQIVAWYQKRWLIEQFFRILKKQGLDLEHAQIAQDKRFLRLTILAIEAALHVLQLTLAKHQIADPPIEAVFSPFQIQLLQRTFTQISRQKRRSSQTHIPAQN